MNDLSGAVVGIVDVPGAPYRSAHDESGRRIFTSVMATKALDEKPSQSDGIAVIDVEARRVERHFPLEQCRGLSLDSTGTRLYVARTYGAVSALDVAALVAGHADPVIAACPTIPGGSTGMVTLTADGQHLVTSEERAQCLTVLDVDRLLSGEDAVSGAVAMDAAPIAVVLSPDGSRMYATSQATGSTSPRGPGGVTVIDATRFASSRDPNLVALGRTSVGNCVRLALSHDGRVVWVTLRAENQLVALDATALEAGLTVVLARLDTRPAPVGLAVLADYGIAVVANSDRFNRPWRDAQTVSVFDIEAALASNASLIGQVTVSAGSYACRARANNACSRSQWRSAAALS